MGALAAASLEACTGWNSDDTCSASVCLSEQVTCPEIRSTCDGVLGASGVVQVTQASTEEAHQLAILKTALCSEERLDEFLNWARQQSRRAAADHTDRSWFDRLDFGVDWSASEAEQRLQLRQWQASLCSERLETLSSRQMTAILSTFTDTTAPVDAWRECIATVASRALECGATDLNARQGLGLTLHPANVGPGHRFVMEISWCGVRGLAGPTTARVEKMTVTGATCDGIPEGKLCGGEVSVVCERDGPGDVVAAVVVAARGEGLARTESAEARMSPLCGVAPLPCCLTGESCGLGEECVAGLCATRCFSGERRCPSGACVVARDDPSACGATCEVCDSPEGGEATCDAGVCGSRCPPAHELCGGACRGNCSLECTWPEWASSSTVPLQGVLAWVRNGIE
ncbi:MAG: hypothetical protein RIT81_17995 [Deltaproteobacteria bacterium]